MMIGSAFKGLYMYIVGISFSVTADVYSRIKRESVPNVGILASDVHHTHLDWSVCKFQAHDRLGSHVTLCIHLMHSMPMFDTLSKKLTTSG